MINLIKSSFIILIILHTSCGTKKPELISILGFQDLMVNYRKSTIDEYLLKEGYEFKEIMSDPQDDFYIPRPVRHNYVNTTKNITIQIAYVGFDPIEVRIKTSDPKVYLQFKKEAREQNFKEDNTMEYEERTEISYANKITKEWLNFIQINMEGINAYVIEYKDITNENKVVEKYRATIPKGIDSVVPDHQFIDSANSVLVDSVLTP